MGIRDRDGGMNLWCLNVTLGIPYILFLAFLLQQPAIFISEWLHCSCPCQSILVDISSCFLFGRKNVSKKQNHLHGFAWIDQKVSINNPLLAILFISHRRPPALCSSGCRTPVLCYPLPVELEQTLASAFI